MPEVTKTLYAPDRKAWHAWLAKHHGTEPEIWLVYYRKDTGKPRVSYNDAVEEALAFGWIDSTVKKLDEERFAQRFSPRRKTSGLSQSNRERVRKLISEGRMTAAGLAAISHVFHPGEPDTAQLEISSDILEPLKADAEAWKNFQRLPDAYRRIRIAYLESQRRHGRDQFDRSLRHFIKMTAKGKRIGFIRG